MSVKIFSKPSCGKCVFLKNFLGDKIDGEKVQYINVFDQPHYIEEFDIKSLPVLIHQDSEGNVLDHLVGYDHKLEEREHILNIIKENNEAMK